MLLPEWKTDYTLLKNQFLYNTVYISFYEIRFLWTSQFTNQSNQSLQKSYLGNTNKIGFYELRFLRTSQFTNCIYGPLKCLFTLTTTDFTNFFWKKSIDESFIFKNMRNLNEIPRVHFLFQSTWLFRHRICTKN